MRTTSTRKPALAKSHAAAHAGPRKTAKKAGSKATSASAVDAVELRRKNPRELELAKHWAPVFYQDTDSTNYRGDFITAINYDGDWRGNNNWENLDSATADMRGVIYYSFVETDSHYFITYGDFHPRDWNEIPYGDARRDGPPPPLPDTSHENDFEGAMVVVEKDGSKNGKFVCLSTQAHGRLGVFTNDPKVKSAKQKQVKHQGIVFEDGGHPALWLQAKGHGVFAMKPEWMKDPKHFPAPDKDGVIYRVADRGTAPRAATTGT